MLVKDEILNKTSINGVFKIINMSKQMSFVTFDNLPINSDNLTFNTNAQFVGDLLIVGDDEASKIIAIDFKTDQSISNDPKFGKPTLEYTTLEVFKLDKNHISVKLISDILEIRTIKSNITLPLR